MKKPIALLYAICSTILLALISYFISIGQPILVFVSSLAALLFIGFGFVLKVKLQKKTLK